MVGGDVRDDRDVVVRDADPAQEDASPGGLEHRDVGMLGEGDRRPRRSPSSPPSSRADRCDRRRRSRRTRRACRPSSPCGRSAAWSWSSRSCRSPGSPGCRDPGTVGSGPGSAAATSRASSAITRAGDRRSTAAIPVATAPASASAAPRRRHGNAMTTCPNSGPVRPRTREPPGADGGGDAPRQLHGDPRGRAQSLIALRAHRDRSRDARSRARSSATFSRSARSQPADIQRELDGGSREIEVGPVEHAELDGPDGVAPSGLVAFRLGDAVDLSRRAPRPSPSRRLRHGWRATRRRGCSGSPCRDDARRRSRVRRPGSRTRSPDGSRGT